jgi:diguanylate cyclase (GGDEF)-like protein
MKSKTRNRTGTSSRTTHDSSAATSQSGNLRFDHEHPRPADVIPTTELLLQLGELQNENLRLREQLDQTARKLTEQSGLLLSLQAEARSDPLTKLLNRRAFDEDLARRVSAWRRRATPFSVVLVDLDHFKSINDRYGHAAGDELLRQFATVLTGAFRDMDLIARIGGDEFALVLPVTNAKEAVIPSERLRHMVATRKFEVNERSLRLTVSVGSTGIQVDDDPRSVVGRADEALYAAKSAGRNLVWSAELGRIEPTSIVR